MNDTQRYLRRALGLAWFTIAYNILEGLVSLLFGMQDDALALFGFGIDSFIEVLSGLGILSMILRVHRYPHLSPRRFEQTALRVTGASFYLLSLGLVATAIYNLTRGHRPETTVPGLLISSLSLTIMWALALAKRRVGRALNSAPILADANCSLVCMYMSIVLLAASAIYHLTGLGFADSLGALGLTYLSAGEGREAFEKANAMREELDDA